MRPWNAPNPKRAWQRFREEGLILQTTLTTFAHSPDYYWITQAYLLDSNKEPGEPGFRVAEWQASVS
jgi:hypothetical protein